MASLCLHASLCTIIQELRNLIFPKFFLEGILALYKNFALREFPTIQHGELIMNLCSLVLFYLISIHYL